MFVKNVFVFLIISLIESLPTFSYKRFKRETITLQPVIQTRAESSSRTTYVITQPTCITVDDPNIPTFISIESNIALLYKIVGYSTQVCSEEYEVISKIMSSQPLEINSHMPVCSFKIGKRPFSSSPLTVIFGYSGRDRPQIFRVNETKCYNICNNDSRYPTTVGIWEEDGRIANNFIQVYEISCEWENFPGEEMNFVKINNLKGRILGRLRLREPGSVVRAFQILPE